MINISEENVKSILELIEELVLNSPKIPILNKLIIDEDKLFSLLDELNKNLPAEMSEAKVIMENKDKLISEATEKSHEIISTSEAKASEMISSAELKANEMITKSETKSNEMINSAQMKAKLLVSESEVIKKALVEVNTLKTEATKEIESKNNEVYGYAESILENLEGQLSTAISVIRNGRESLSK